MEDKRTTSEEIREIFNELSDLVVSKNTDYGDSVFESPVMCPGMSGGMAIRVRLSDKIKRAIQLESHPAQVSNESLADAYRDMIGYCALRLIQLKELQDA